MDTPCAKRATATDSLDNESEDDDDDDDNSSSDSCSTSAEEGMAAVEERVCGAALGANVHADVDRMYRHARTKMLHYAHVNDMHRTCCGRAVSDTFTVYRKDPDMAWPKCRICFGK